jgi:DNA-binding NarL/FixJ family response regulator
VASISVLTVCHEFMTARRILLATPPDLLVTNFCLGAYNGLHLAHLVAANRFSTKVVVYSIRRDAVLVADARNAGAFVEDFSGLAGILPSYLGATSHFLSDSLGAS